MQSTMNSFSEARYHLNVNIMVIFHNHCTIGIRVTKAVYIIADMLCPSLKEPLDIANGLGGRGSGIF